MKRIILESPYAGDVEANLAYARRAARVCAELGEAILASHLLYPQFLDDNLPEERELGIQLGLLWTPFADYSVFFTDRGWSRGMLAALDHPRVLKLRALDGPVQLPPLLGNWLSFIDMEHGEPV